MAIAIGAEAINRASTRAPLYTRIALDNPALASGTIDTIEVWANSNLTGFRAGTFFLVSGTTYQCRDSETIGNVTAGSKQTFTLNSIGNPISIDVVTGDYLGIYWGAGNIEYDTSGYAGMYSVSGEWIDPGDQTSYTLITGTPAFSAHGTGAEAGGWANIDKVSGVDAADIAKVKEVAVTDVAKIMGVAV